VEGYSPLMNANLADPVQVEIADRHGVTPAQVVIRWHIEYGICCHSEDEGRTGSWSTAIVTCQHKVGILQTPITKCGWSTNGP
jgi:hypothetical protein